MTIVKATLLTNLNNALGRTETSIDVVLARALILLTVKYPALRKNTTFSVVAGDARYSATVSGELATDFRDVVSIRLNDGTKYKTPLVRLPSWADYLERIAEETTADRDEPTHFIVYNRSIYMWPTPDATFTAYLEYSAIDAEVGSIELEDAFEPALQYLLEFCYLEYKGLGTTADATLKAQLAADAIKDIVYLRGNQDAPQFVKYNDI
ncbi:MAG: hypothetical protein QME51_01755 [Planctomycetota bacterium]|nr:hypothetical protein [Planctomycetota bacterium]